MPRDGKENPPFIRKSLAGRAGPKFKFHSPVHMNGFEQMNRLLMVSADVERRYLSAFRRSSVPFLRADG